MKPLLLAAATVALAAGSAAASPVGPTIAVTPWLAPNAFGSPSFDGAVANEEQALLNGQTTGGTAGTPTYFQAQTTPVGAAQAIVTGFPSWMGQISPATAFGPAFANELGNRFTFGLLINGNGTQFSISQLSFVGTSSDAGNALGFSYNAGDYDYGTGYEGIIDANHDGILGDLGDTFVTSGPNTQLVDGLVGRGSGNSIPAYCTTCTLADQQASLDAAADFIGIGFDFTGVYTLTDANGGQVTGSGTFDVLAPSSIPEPATIALLGGALFGFAKLRRGKRKA